MASACQVRAATYDHRAIGRRRHLPVHAGLLLWLDDLPRASLQGAPFGLPRLTIRARAVVGLLRGGGWGEAGSILRKCADTARRNSSTFVTPNRIEPALRPNALDRAVADAGGPQPCLYSGTRLTGAFSCIGINTFAFTPAETAHSGGYEGAGHGSFFQSTGRVTRKSGDREHVVERAGGECGTRHDLETQLLKLTVQPLAPRCSHFCQDQSIRPTLHNTLP